MAINYTLHGVDNESENKFIHANFNFNNFDEIFKEVDLIICKSDKSREYYNFKITVFDNDSLRLITEFIISADGVHLLADN